MGIGKTFFVTTLVSELCLSDAACSVIVILFRVSLAETYARSLGVPVLPRCRSGTPAYHRYPTVGFLPAAAAATRAGGGVEHRAGRSGGWKEPYGRDDDDETRVTGARQPPKKMRKQIDEMWLQSLNDTRRGRGGEKKGTGTLVVCFFFPMFSSSLSLHEGRKETGSFIFFILFPFPSFLTASFPFPFPFLPSFLPRYRPRSDMLSDCDDSTGTYVEVSEKSQANCSGRFSQLSRRGTFPW